MLDDTDQKIISMLNEDGRVNNNEIAKQLDISEGTVRNRIKKLLNSGILKVSGLVNPETIEEKQVIVLGINVRVTSDMWETAEQISKLQDVQSVHVTTGRYDLIVEAWVDLKYGLKNLLSDSFTKIEGIVSTESFMVLKSFDKWVSENN